MKVFDFANVSLHNNKNDCWVIINARVYDVTKFLDDHPGGDTVLLDVAGKNASEEFEEAGHGSAARLMLDEYYIGEADPLTPSFKTINSKPETHQTQQRLVPSWFGFMVKSPGFFLPLAILGGIIGLLNLYCY
ncbi:hypothetical protein SSX86_029512 [Deinandra increscens subsp. villosa]|uniref:Cytochrome b5 heme-binding domain-containing protein n=1 Tax=Deinandra increscens subsp. villosa TaxID=3103831 RepID=A0AAP0CFS3_9ASTR